MKITSTLLSLIVAAAFSFQATSAKATIYIADTQANGLIGESQSQSPWDVNEQLRGQFDIDLANPSINTFFQSTTWFDGLSFTFTQKSAGTASFDATTRLFTLTDAAVEIVWYQGCTMGKACGAWRPYAGTLNLAFYLSENLRDIASVADSNYVTVIASTWWNTTDYLYTPSRIDLDYTGTVPLPASAWLLGSGLLGLVASSKRKFRDNRA